MKKEKKDVVGFSSVMYLSQLGLSYTFSGFVIPNLTVIKRK